jgi:hypothetical protein
MNVATEILNQLGGNRFAVMTGAKAFGADGNALVFRLPSNFAKDGINAVRVTLDPCDTYTVRFMRVRGTSMKLVNEVAGVYNVDLRDVFTEATGLLCTMGTLRGA